MARSKHRQITAEDMAHRRIAEGHSLTPGQEAAVERERAEQASAPATADDPLLALPGVMRCSWWSRCRSCDGLIHGPGSNDLPCPCGEVHPRGDVVALADTPSGRAWVCRSCHPSQHLTRQLTQPGDPLTQPPDPMTLPEPRRGDRDSEGAKR